jgi:ribulose-phosphate 3-epimerase
MIDARGLDVELEVDGGVAPGTAAKVVEAGARVLVAGSAIYGHPDYAVSIAALRADGALGLERTPKK